MAFVAPSVQEKSRFPALPASWFHFSRSDELRPGPLKVTLSGRPFVGYRTESGRAVVLSGQCSHMGAHLSRGHVHGERLVCPLHGWEYGTSGICERIPAGDQIPAFARQQSFPVQELGGHVFFFSRSEARFPLPFFEGVSPCDLLPARPFELLADVAWYFVGANGFDIQHFRMAHDRTLLEEPEVSSPSPFARRVVAQFAVSGDSPQDRLTRWIAGPRVRMEVTAWAGTVILVRATFARTTTYGMFNVLPINGEQTLGRVIVWIKRSKTALGRMFFDPMNAAIRRLFIHAFLRSDLPRIAGLRYQPGNLIAADQIMADYFKWLETASHAQTTDNI
jgi:phenylpropionate dioxygenase-like ring-hydroxylating dioxygenase large terminal subunit